MSKYKLSKVRFLLFLFIFLATIFSFLVSKNIIHAQQPTDNGQIPSDLALDLNLAQQNPAPDQQQIVQSETKQAEVVTDTGETTVVTPQDTIVPGVKTESRDNAINPEQTTSEQVITQPEQVNVDDNGTPVPTGSDQNQGSPTGDQPTDQPTGIQSQNGVTGEPSPTDNFVPGTNVSQPNDNAAPLPPDTNPNLPAPTQSSDTQPSEAPAQQNTIPQESSPATQDNNGSSQQANPPTDTNTSGDSSVQGASTGPNPVIVFIQKIINLFTGNNK